jgi:hypothetical protein
MKRSLSGPKVQFFAGACYYFNKGVYLPTPRKKSTPTTRDAATHKVTYLPSLLLARKRLWGHYENTI